MKDALEGLAPFVREHYVESTVWNEGVLENWLSWAATNGYLMVAMDEEKKPVGLVIARTVKEIPAQRDLSPFTEDGQIIYIDFAIAPNKNIMKALGWAVLQRYGERPFLAYRNNAHRESPENLRIHETAKVAKALLKLEK